MDGRFTWSVNRRWLPLEFVEEDRWETDLLPEEQIFPEVQNFDDPQEEETTPQKERWTDLGFMELNSVSE